MALLVRNSRQILLQKNHKCKTQVVTCGESMRSLMLATKTKVSQDVLVKASAAVSSSPWLQSLYKETSFVRNDTDLINTAHLNERTSRKCTKACSRLNRHLKQADVISRLKQSTVPNWSSSAYHGTPNHWYLSADKLAQSPAKLSSSSTQRTCDTDRISTHSTDSYLSHTNSTHNDDKLSESLARSINVDVITDPLHSSHTLLFSGGKVDLGKLQGDEAAFSDGEGSGGEKGGDDRRGPTLAQLKEVEFLIQEKMPKFFHEPHPYAIYVPEIEFHNNIAEKPYVTKGLLPYVWTFTKLRVFAHVNYVRVEMRILKTTVDEDMGIVQVRWQVYGMPQSMAIKVWKAFKENEVVLDGFSTLSVNKDGKIWKHVADNVMPDDERKRRRMTFVERLRERWRLRPVTGLNATAKK